METPSPICLSRLLNLTSLKSQCQEVLFGSNCHCRNLHQFLNFPYQHIYVYLIIIKYFVQLFSEIIQIHSIFLSGLSWQSNISGYGSPLIDGSLVCPVRRPAVHCEQDSGAHTFFLTNQHTCRAADTPCSQSRPVIFNHCVTAQQCVPNILFF